MATRTKSILGNQRSVLRAAAAATILASAAGNALAASQFELVGTYTGTGSVTATILAISPDADVAQLSVGTYSHSGGAFPMGGGVAGGGIDATLSIARGPTILATSDNLTATNKDAEVRTANMAGRAGASVFTSTSWAESYKIAMAPVNGASLGNGSFSLVSHIPGSGIQYVHSLATPAGATLGGMRATNTHVNTKTEAMIFTGDAAFTGGSLTLEEGNYTALDMSMGGGTNVSVIGAGTFKARRIFYADKPADRGTITVTGSGGMDVEQLWLADHYTDASAIVNQHSGRVKTHILQIDRSESVNTSSFYNLYGGTLESDSIYIYDGALRVMGGTVNVPGVYSFQNSTLGSKVVWDSGKIAITDSATTVVNTSTFFGSVLTLGGGRSLSVNAPGITSFVNLSGGKLALRELADNGVAMNWQSGELEVTGAAGASLGVGKVLGDQLALRQGMTLRTTGTLTMPLGSRLLLSDGGRAILGGLSNTGEVRLSGNGEASLDISGAQSIGNSGVITGTGRIAGSVLNNTRIEVGDVDRLRITGNISNNGQIRLTGGELLVDGLLVNNAAGKLTGRGTLAVGAIDNRGTLTFSAGLSDVDTSLFTNRGAAKVIVTGAGNTTFYGNIVNEAGSEIRISADSRATFLGTVTNLSAFTGSGTKVFDGPAGGAALMTGSGSTTVEAGGSLDVAGIREASLTLRGEASLAAGSIVSRLGSLTFDGGTLDLRDNAIVLDYAAGASPLASIRSAIFAGDLTSSSLGDRHAIALVEGSTLGRPAVGDVPVDATSLVVSLALRGDADVNGRVEFADLLSLAQNYGLADRGWGQGDFNADAAVNFTDLLALAQNYGTSLLATQEAASLLAPQGSSFASDYALAMSLVPEPTSTLAALGLLATAARRRPR